MNSHLPSVKYFIMISLKVIYEVNIAVLAIQNCLSKRLGLQCSTYLADCTYVLYVLDSSPGIVPNMKLQRVPRPGGKWSGMCGSSSPGYSTA
jgi:hypothetical protein